jgi:hypothetical protein
MSDRPLLISVHLPKTGGQSFNKSLMGFFGESFRKDYGSFNRRRLISSRFLALAGCVAGAFRSYRGVECIHGHFMPLKYLLAGMRSGVRFITWMRDPIERLGSQYHYLKRKAEAETNPSRDMGPLERRVLEGCSLEELGMSPEVRNLYSRYMWGFPLRRFDFIGVTEYFDEDMRYFAKTFLGQEIPVHVANANPERKDGLYVSDPAVRRRLEAFHAEDMSLYKTTLERRRARMGSMTAAKGRL